MANYCAPPHHYWSLFGLTPLPPKSDVIYGQPLISCIGTEKGCEIAHPLQCCAGKITKEKMKIRVILDARSARSKRKDVTMVTIKDA